MSAQDRTLDQYHEFMKMNAVSHVIRAARQLGIFSQLAEGQKTTSQLVAALSLKPVPAEQILDLLVTTGYVEKYDEDYALSQAAQLLCQYDDDLGDSRWGRLTQVAKGEAEEPNLQAHFDRVAATQWIHTGAAIQAAEILNIGGEGEQSGIAILDLGCGSAVWSCAIAHKDPDATLMLVDGAAALQAARSMAESIELIDRVDFREGDPVQSDLPDAHFDLVLIAQRLNTLNQEMGNRLLSKAISACRPGGRVVVIDLFQSPAQARLGECIESLKLEVDTTHGRVPTLRDGQKRFQDAGLSDVQFTFLAASRVNMGLMVGICPKD